MRGRRMDFAAWTLCLITVGSVRAGVYNTEAPLVGPTPKANGVQPLPFSLFQQQLADLRQLRVEQPASSLRQASIKRRDELQAQQARAGSITEAERVNLSAYLIRLGQYDEAAEVLAPVSRGTRNFMVLANLATANQLAGHLSRAWDYLRQALDIWPSQWTGLSPEQLAWYQQVEKYQLKLLRGRMQEERRQPPGGARKQPENLDSLFDVSFVGDSGSYEAGKLAAAELKKLPRDDLAIVQQLVLWLPDDTRLYWLLGELYNAHGDPGAARQIFEDCLWARRWTAPDLKSHHRVVAEFKPAPAVDLTPAAAGAPNPPPSAWPTSGKLLVVGALAGLVIVALAYLQVRQFRRRRQRSEARNVN